MPEKKLLLDKVLVIVGPTSSGKSELAVQLAKRFSGEIVSCDSRQIYKGMNLGTGKVPGKWTAKKARGREFSLHLQEFTYKDVTHHLIDFVNPKKQYSAALFKKQAQKIIDDIIHRRKLPILCGGAGHWIDCVVYDQEIPDVRPNLKLRKELKEKSAAELFHKLEKLDECRAATIDRYNIRRLIRALEIVLTTGKPVPLFKQRPKYNALWIGIQMPQSNLYKKIDQRLKLRFKAGMIKEVQNLRNFGLSWKKLENFGLEYKYVSLFLQKKLSYDEMFSKLFFAIKHYAQRQMTWWQRNKEINWIKKPRRAVELTKRFI